MWLLTTNLDYHRTRKNRFWKTVHRPLPKATFGPKWEVSVRTEQFGKWVILIFRGQKLCTRIISSIWHSFLPFSRAITPKKRFVRDPATRENKLQISFKFHKMKSYAWQFYLCFLNSCEIFNLFSRDPIKKNCLWCHYRSLITPKAFRKSTKKNALRLKIFWHKVFVHRKLKLLNSLMDFVLTLS